MGKAGAMATLMRSTARDQRRVAANLSKVAGRRLDAGGPKGVLKVGRKLWSSSGRKRNDEISAVESAQLQRRSGTKKSRLVEKEAAIRWAREDAKRKVSLRILVEWKVVDCLLQEPATVLLF